MIPVSITLTTDELLVFLSILGIASINGLETEPFADLSEEEVAAKLNAGEHSLVSRGLLSLESEGTVVLDDTLTALVGSAVIPGATLMLSIMHSSGAHESHYFSFTPDLMVEHFTPQPGIFWFGHLLEVESVRLRLQTLVAPIYSVTQTDEAHSVHMAATDLAAFVQECRRNNSADAKAHLLESGYSPLFVKKFAADYLAYPSWVAVSGWGLRKAEPDGSDSVMVVQGKECCWLVKNVRDDRDRVQIHAADGRTCENEFLRLLHPLASLAMSLL